MTPFSSVAILEKLALLKMALCKAPVFCRASFRRTSVFCADKMEDGRAICIKGTLHFSAAEFLFVPGSDICLLSSTQRRCSLKLYPWRVFQEGDDEDVHYCSDLVGRATQL